MNCTALEQERGAVVREMKTVTATKQPNGSVANDDIGLHVVQKTLHVSRTCSAVVSDDASDIRAEMIGSGVYCVGNHDTVVRLSRPHASSLTDTQSHRVVRFQGDLENTNGSNNYRPYETVAIGEYDWQVRGYVRFHENFMKFFDYLKFFAKLL